MLAEEQNLTDASSDDEIIGVRRSEGNDNATTPDTPAPVQVSENTTSEKSPGSKKRKKSRGERIKIGKRIKTRRGQLYHVLKNPDQRGSIPTNSPNSFNLYGSIVGGDSVSGWKVKYDILPNHRITKFTGK